MQKDNILVWLPSPMGDAILCTPALRAIRENFKSAEITFLANRVVREVLSPGSFNDEWLELNSDNPFAIAKRLKKHSFTQAILFKNSFGSALSVFLAGIPSRIGYARQWRGLFLTEKLYPEKLPNGKYKPVSMIDYYLAIASWLGADTNKRELQLSVEPQSYANLKSKIPQLINGAGPIVILVPGGAFGPSKCWLSNRFAQTADRLISRYKATVIISVSPEPAEKKIAKEICDASSNVLINLGEQPLSQGELKGLFSISELVICNDTGPRHIAIAFGRKIITLFGPNDPAWTQTGHEKEIQIVGTAPCAPCLKPVCRKSEHLCMQSITVDSVCEAAESLLEDKKEYVPSYAQQKFVEISKSFFVDTDFKKTFEQMGLVSINAVFSFSSGQELTKKNLAQYRSRIQFETDSPQAILFLKRFEKPPVQVQVEHWCNKRKHISLGVSESELCNELAGLGFGVPKVVAYGRQWGNLFEKRSFVITEKIPNAESLEKKLPDCFYGSSTTENIKLRREFIAKLAEFVRMFHNTGFRHRDLYLCHIFCDNKGEFHLIDLARTFKPVLLADRFRVKDIAQLYYSASGKYFSGTDRLRFYLEYVGCSELFKKDKRFIGRVKSKVKQMACHDKKHSRYVPFEEQAETATSQQ